MTYREWYEKQIKAINDGGHVVNDDIIIPDDWLTNTALEVECNLRAERAGG